MSNNLVSQRLPISNGPMEAASDKVDTSVVSMGMGMMETMSSYPSSPLFAVSNQHKGPEDTISYISGSENLTASNKHLAPNQDVRVLEPMWNNLGSQKLSLPTKRKATVEPLLNNHQSQQSSVMNKRVAQMEPLHSSTGLSQQSALNKRPGQMQSMPTAPWPHNLPNKRMVRNESISSKSGSQRVQTPKSRTATAVPSPKGRTESFETVRSKMRETLAAALSVVSENQEKASKEEKTSPREAVNSPLQANVDSEHLDSTVSPVLKQTVSADKLKGYQSSAGETAAKESIENSKQTGKSDGQEPQFNYVIPDGDVPFSDSFFVKDELLQGNGLTWAWDIDVSGPKEVHAAQNLQLVNVDAGGKENEQMVNTPQDLAFKIEAELFKLFGGVNKKYKEKGRSLMFNLKDRNNPELRERVLSGEISPERLCSMTPEELASKELSEWRMAKAEELAQMIVLPDSDVDFRRLVKKTHKGEYQVEVEQDDSVSVEVSVGSTSFTQFRPKRRETEAHPSSEADGVKDKDNVEGEKSSSENHDPSCSLTIPADGADFMQGLIVDEFKDEELPPIVSLDEFMESLNSEPPFENLPVDDARMKLTIDKENSDTGDEMVASDPASSNPGDTQADNSDQTSLKTTEPELNAATGQSSAVRKTSPLGSTSLAERVWEGELQLNVSSLITVIGLFRSGEKTSTKEWPSSLEIKGRVRLDAFEKFLQELPMSRSRAVMVVHFLLKDASSENERTSLSEAVDSYFIDERLGFGEPSAGVEVYFCPPRGKVLEMLSRHLAKNQTDILNATDNGLIGVVVWRRAHLSSAISPNSSSHHKHSSKKQNFSSRRQENINSNVNSNLTTMPYGHQLPINRRLPPPPPDNDDDDDIPPGFGPGAARDEDDLPEFNFSGSLNSSGRQTLSPRGSRMTQTHVSSRPVDQMRQLVQKYGQTGAATVGRPGLRTRQWDDDDDIPEWQPQIPQPPSMHSVQQPLQPHIINQQIGMMAPRPPLVQVGPPTAMNMQPPVNVAQNASRVVQPPHGHGLRPNASGQYYGAQWRQDAPRSRGF